MASAAPNRSVDYDRWVLATLGIDPAGYPAKGTEAGALAPAAGGPGVGAEPVGGGPRPIKMPSVSGDSKAALVASMQALDSISRADKANGLYTITINGQPQQITEQQVNDLRTKTQASIKHSVSEVQNRASSALSRYQAQKDVDDDHPIISRVVKFVEKVKTLGSFEDPGDDLGNQCTIASIQSTIAISNAYGLRFVDAANALADAEAASYKAAGLARAYCDGIQDGGSLSVKILEATRDTAFAVDAALAIVVTGGAASGAVGATTTAFGAEVATVTTANAIATAAPIMATVGNATARASLGEKVDWGATALDVGLQLFLAKFGGKAAEGIGGAVTKRLTSSMAADGIARIGVSKIVNSLILQEGSATLQVVTQTVYAKLRGKDITKEQFFDSLVDALSDPQGLAVAAVLGSLDAKITASVNSAAPHPAEHPTGPASEPN